MDFKPKHKQFYNMFLTQLKDVYCAEDQIAQAIPNCLESISSDELKKKLKNHYEETKKQKERLGKIFEQLNETPQKGTCEGIKGLLEECNRIASQEMRGVVRDAALISALQKIEHYEIATYGALRTFAKHLELDEIEDMLEDILEEERNADENLTYLAEGGWFTSGINAEAAQQSR